MRELLCGIVMGFAVGAPVGAWWCVIMMHYNRKRKRIEMAKSYKNYGCERSE